jgi:photosystem II stability/assembly factor-like uncharacterized protein
MLHKNTIKLIAVIAALLFTNLNSFAHFGSKGPLGGTVTAFHVLKKKNGSADSVIFAGTANGGVYQSTNGTSWSARPVGLKSGKITALVHTGTYLFAATADSGIFRFTGFVSADRYWEKVNTGLTNLSITSLISTDETTIFAGTNGSGIYKSVDKGDNWISVNNHNLHHLDITCLTKKGNRIYAASEGVWGSDDLGTSWFDANDIYTDHIAKTNAISYNPNTNQLLVSNENGIYVSTVNSDTLLTFTLVETGLPSGYKINSISNDINAWYLSTDQGVFISYTNPIVWNSVNTGLKTNIVNSVCTFNTTIIAGTSKIGIYTATAPATSWKLTNTGFNNITTYSIATSDSISIVANEYGVFVSKNIISSTIKPYIQSNKGLIDSLNVTDIIFADFCIIATTKNEGVFFSPDTCKNWNQINSGLTNLNIVKTYYSNGKKYVICSNGNVYESDLHSSSWTMISSNLPIGTTSSSLTFFSDKILLTSKNKGVFVKTLAGSNWIEVNTGLSNMNVNASCTQHDKVFIGTNGNGVFVSDTASISWSATLSKPKGSHTDLMNNNYYVDYIESMLSNEGYVFAGYKGGLYATADNGKTWIVGGNQFNLPTFTNVNKISIAKGRVFVTTDNNSVYSNGLSELPALISLSSTISTAVNNVNLNIPVAISLSSVIPVSKIEIYDGVDLIQTITNGDLEFSLLNPSVGIHSLKSVVTFINGLTSTSTALNITITSITSIEEFNNNNFKVYPNPNNGNFELNLNNELSNVTITDVTGLKVAELKNVSDLQYLNLNLSKGLYIVNIVSDSNSSTIKVIVE